ncbi:hypothetical protein U1Q18_006417 [Sarracenia purpurea var. burkii]
MEAMKPSEYAGQGMKLNTYGHWVRRGGHSQNAATVSGCICIAKGLVLWDDAKLVQKLV